MEDKVIKFTNKKGLAVIGTGCYSFEIAGTSYKQASPGILPVNPNSRQRLPIRIGDFEIIPNGDDNRYPYEIRELMDEEVILEEFIQKKVDLLWGQGPALFRTITENGTRRRDWTTDPEIESWLESFEYEDYLMKVITDLRTVRSYYDKIRLNLGARLNMVPKIVRIEYVEYKDCRLEWNDFLAPKRIIVGDFERPWISGLTSFPVFEHLNPFRNEVAMNYNSLPQYGLNKTYSRASFHGAINWIKNSIIIPKVLLSLNINISAIKVHLKIPEIIIEKKIEEIRTKAAESQKQITQQEIDTEIDNYIAALINTVTGSGNVGKLLYTTDVFDPVANEYASVKIEPIDLKVKEYISAQLDIAKQASFETSAGLGLHPALSNLSHQGNLPSGSEQLYAYKLFLLTSIDIVERIATKTINTAIKANWPGKNLKLGFFHTAIMSESEVTPSKRTKNLEQ